MKASATSTMWLSRSATCFFSPRGCWTIVTKSPGIALPSAAMRRLKPNCARSAGPGPTATRAKSRVSSARKNVFGSREKRSGWSGWPSRPSSYRESMPLPAGVAGLGAALEVADVDEVLGVDDPLENRAGGAHGGGLTGREGGGADGPDVRVVMTQPVDAGRHPLRGVRLDEPLRRLDRRDPLLPLVRAVGDPLC